MIRNLRHQKGKQTTSHLHFMCNCVFSPESTAEAKIHAYELNHVVYVIGPLESAKDLFDAELNTFNDNFFFRCNCGFFPSSHMKAARHMRKKNHVVVVRGKLCSDFVKFNDPQVSFSNFGRGNKREK
jgi:hypothetical protein